MYGKGEGKKSGSSKKLGNRKEGSGKGNKSEAEVKKGGKGNRC